MTKEEYTSEEEKRIMKACGFSLEDFELAKKITMIEDKKLMEELAKS